MATETATATADIPAGAAPVTLNINVTTKALDSEDVPAADDMTQPVIDDPAGAKTMKPGHMAYKAFHDGVGGAVTAGDGAMASCESPKMQKAWAGCKGGLRKLHAKMMDAASAEYAADDDWDGHRKGLDDIYGPDGIPDTGDEPAAEDNAEAVTVNVDADGDEPETKGLFETELAEHADLVEKTLAELMAEVKAVREWQAAAEPSIEGTLEVVTGLAAGRR